MTEIRNSQGVSLVEVMVAVGIVGIISLGVAQLISTVSQVQSNVSIVVVRDQLGSQYAGFLDMADSRIHTLAANTDLYNHAHGIAPAPAGEFESDTNVYPLAIYDHNNELLIPESGLFLTKSGSVCSADGLPANSCSPEKAWFQVKADWVANAGTSHQIRLTVGVLPDKTSFALRPFQALRTYMDAGAGDDQWDVSCFPSDGGNYFNCCRMDTRTGATFCKVAHGSGGAWLNFAFQPFVAGPAGSYSLTCFPGTGVNFNCCRLNKATGQVLCKAGNGSGNPWAVFAHPNPF